MLSMCCAIKLNRIISQLSLSRTVIDSTAKHCVIVIAVAYLQALRHKHIRSERRSSSTNRHRCTCSERTSEATMETFEDIQRSIPVSWESKLMIAV